MKTRIVRMTYSTLLTLLALIIFSTTVINAAPGDLDLTFGSGGIVITGGNNTLDGAADMAIQADGKIVLVGQGGDGGPYYNFAVVRYNTDGSLDTSFGGTGIVITSVDSSFGASSVAIQADGKIVVAGNSLTLAPSSFAVVRYNPNGSLDTSFNGTGIVITPIGTSASYAEAVAIQADGKIVATGTRDDGFRRIVLVRYNTDGSLDTTFNGSGIVITTINTSFCEAKSVAIQSDGKIVVAGDGFSLEGIEAFSVVRYSPNGLLDTSFNGTGIVTTPFGGAIDEAQSVAIQADGRIVVGGRSITANSSSSFAFARYDPNGSLDTSFSGTGKLLLPFGNSFDTLSSIAVQADGKIVACGGAGAYPGFAVVRLNPNGALDTTFGGTGKIISCIGYGCGGAASVAIQADGRIVVAGTANVDMDDFVDFAVVRYEGGSNANIRTRFDFDGDGRADVSVFRPSNGAWYLNRSTAGFLGVSFGNSTDKVTPADFDGDGKTDIAVYRPGTRTWYVLNSSNGTLSEAQYGESGDLPTPADYDGDGRADFSLFRPSNGTWYRLTAISYTVQFGASEDKPTVGDFDGDGRADIAVWRPSNRVWYRLNSSNGAFVATMFGISTDLITPADLDGDSKTDIAVYRPSTGIWYWLNSSNGGFNAAQFGIAEDIPSAADFDGDGKADISVFRPSDGVWYRLNSSNGSFLAMQFGATGDRPTPSAFRY